MVIRQCMRDCKLSPSDCPNLLPRESFQAMAQRGGTQVEPDSLPKLGRGEWESREAQGARDHRAGYQKGEGYTKRELWKFAEGPSPVFT